MVSIRCEMIVKAELQSMGLHCLSIDTGEINIYETLLPEQLAVLKAGLSNSGLELIDNRKGKIVEKIKGVVIEMVHYSDNLPKIKFSEYISKKLGLDYTYLSNLFTEVHGSTIAHFIIMHKIERVKELLTYEEMSLKEIANLMQYSSVAHLANQFKKITDFSTSHFKKIKLNRRNYLTEL